MRDHAAQQSDGFTFRHAANDQRSVAILGNQVIDIHTKINSLTPYASAHVWRPAGPVVQREASTGSIINGLIIHPGA